jgi:hypothetical protein
MRLRKSNPHFSATDPRVNDQIRANPYAYFAALTSKECKVFNVFAYWSNQLRMCYIRQDTIARFVGLSREHVNRIIHKFKKDGLLSSNYRHLTSCEYKLSSFFNDFFIRSQLKRFISQFVYLPIALLQPHITQYIRFIYKSIGFDTVTCYDTNLHTRARTRERYPSPPRREMIAAYVNEIEDIQLTAEDKVHLSRYSPEAVAYGLRQVRKAHTVHNPAAYLIACCKSFKKNTSPHATTRTPSSSGRPDLPKKQVSSGRQQEIRDDEFWKRDKEKMAHWDLAHVAAKIHRNMSYASSLGEILITQIKEAHHEHVAETCHLCREFGPAYIHPFERVTPTNSPLLPSM